MDTIDVILQVPRYRPLNSAHPGYTNEFCYGVPVAGGYRSLPNICVAFSIVSSPLVKREVVKVARV